jgi:SAM-dependent methyltransferase
VASTVRKPIVGALRAVGLGPTAVRVRRQLRYWRRRDLRRQNAEFLREGAPDGWPVPPPELVFRVVGHHDLAKFYAQSVGRGNYIRNFLGRNSLDVGQFGALLDFGCGCGRVARQWGHLESTKVYGSDIEPDLIAWCQQYLTFGEFVVNRLAPPLPYPDQAFDFAYAISVFTHLPADLQQPWMDEMARVIKPGGYLLFTTHGPEFFDRLTASEVERANAGQVVVRTSSQAGTNMCAAYHTPEGVAGIARGLFEVIDRVPGSDAPSLSGFALTSEQLAARGGVAPARQDGYLIRRLAPA